MRYASSYGPIGSSWERSGGRTRLAVSIPANTTASVRLDGAAVADVTEGGSALGRRAGILSYHQVEDEVIVEVGSGDYEFASGG